MKLLKNTVDVLQKPLYLFFFLFIIYVGISFIPKSEGMSITNGDEPHYIMMTYALTKDGNINHLKNWYKTNVYKEWYGAPIVPHLILLNGKIYAYHQIGLAYFLIPGYILGGLHGIWMTMALFAALGMTSLFFILRYYLSKNISLLTTLIMALSLPIGIFSNQIYPETFLFFLITTIVAYILNPRFKMTIVSGIVLAVLIAIIPTLHIKFIVISGIISLYILVNQFKKIPLYGLILFNCLIGLLIGSYLIWLNGYYDGHLKGAMDAIAANTTLSLLEVPTGLLGILVDRENGILIYSPFYIYIFYGAVVMVKKVRKMEFQAALTYLFPLILTTLFTIFFTMFPYVMGGMNPPGRYNLPVMAGMGVMFGLALRESFRNPLGRIIAIVLMVYSLTVFCILSANPILALPFNVENMLFFYLFKGNAHVLINVYLPNLSKYFRSIPPLDLIKGVVIFSLLVIVTSMHHFVSLKTIIKFVTTLKDED